MSIRLRLALWYTGLLAGTLVIFGVLLYSLMEQHMMSQRDENIVSTAHHMATAMHVNSSLPLGQQGMMMSNIDAFESPGVYVQVLDPDGQIVEQSDNLGQTPLPVDRSHLVAAEAELGTLFTAHRGSDQVRVYITPLTFGPTVGFVEVGQSYRETYDVLASLRLILIGGGLTSLAVAGLVGWGIAKGAIRPKANITRTARAIAQSGGFSRRLETVASKDEVGELGVTLNEMLASLEQAYATQQRFVADASHELRTPLTAVRANLELLDRQGDELVAEERRVLLQGAIHESDRMARLVSDLLSLARADAGQELRLRPTEVDRILMDVWPEARLLAKTVNVEIKAIDQATVLADPDRLKQLILILVDNAIRYTPAGGKVELSLRKDDGTATLEVRDTGIGISPQDISRIFDRFYRADKARRRDVGGTGLGLSIARWIVQQHNGDITVASVPGTGSNFTVQLPLALTTARTGTAEPSGHAATTRASHEAPTGLAG